VTHDASRLGTRGDRRFFRTRTGNTSAAPTRGGGLRARHHRQHGRAHRRRQAADLVGFDYHRHVAEARQAGIVVETILCGGDMQAAAVWQEIAARGRGYYAQIDGQGGMPPSRE